NGCLSGHQATARTRNPHRSRRAAQRNPPGGDRARFQVAGIWLGRWPPAWHSGEPRFGLNRVSGEVQRPSGVEWGCAGDAAGWAYRDLDTGPPGSLRRPRSAAARRIEENISWNLSILRSNHESCSALPMSDAD